jgi:hypothetical protein
MRTDGRTDRETDMTKLIVSFRNFANAPKNMRSREMWLKFYMICHVAIFSFAYIQPYKQTCIVMYIRCEFVGFVNERFMQMVSMHSLRRMQSSKRESPSGSR